MPTNAPTECQSVQRALAAGGTLSAPLADHVRTCAVCTAVMETPAVDSLLRRGTAPEDDAATAAQWGALAARLDRERGLVSWLRERPRDVVRLVAGALFVAVVVLVTRLAATGHPVQTDSAAGYVGLFFFFVGGVAEVIRPLFLPARSPFSLAITGAIGVVGAVVLACWGGTLAPVSLDLAFTRQAWACLRFGVFTSAPLALWLFATARSRGSRLQRWVTACTATTLGLWALEVHCPIGDVAHRLLGHATVVVLCAIVAAAWPTGQRAR